VNCTHCLSSLLLLMDVEVFCLHFIDSCPDPLSCNFEILSGFEMSVCLLVYFLLDLVISVFCASLSV
jgi:hypothetical protein